MRKNKKSNTLGILGIIGVVLIMGIVLMNGVEKKRDELKELQNKQQRLEDELDAEKTRAEILEEKRVYVKTKKYVEDIAKQFGLVYPDEIIYKPNK